MSYILDALKRADAERERGRVPGLHSQPQRRAPEPVWRQRVTSVRVAALLMLLMLGAGAFWSWRVFVPDVPGTSLPVNTSIDPAAAPPAAIAAAPATAGPVEPPAQPRPATPAMPALPLLAPAPVVTASAPPPNATAAVPRFSDLPAEQRAQLPPLNVNGASYSENPAHRMLIVNGQVLKEGQPVAPGWVLERIGPHDAVLQHQGQRLSIGY